MIKYILDLLFPKNCVLCDTQGSLFCENCKNTKLRYYKKQFCHVCKKEVASGFVHNDCKSKSNLDGVLIAVHYNNSAKVIIEEIKYNLYFSIVSELGKLMRQVYINSGIDCKVIIPVPLHKFKENFRGFNQAELLAKEMGIPIINCLSRIKNTKTQVNLNRAQRIENLKDVFKLKEKLEASDVLLVDDIMTTGTTLEECSKVLKKSGVKRVYGLVFARD